jgi:hypothetical protein
MKVRASGGGRCNFTNRSVAAENYVSENPHFCRSALSRYGPADFLSLIGKHGIRYEEREHGRLFCLGSAERMTDLLERECRAAGVEFRLGCAVKKAGRESSFVLETGHGTFFSESLVIATGGLSWKKLGATGLGYRLAEQFGLRVTPLRPGLTPLMWRKKDLAAFGALSGISLRIALRCGQQIFCDDVLFTHGGLSGPAALQASLYWREGLMLEADLVTGIKDGELFPDAGKQKTELKNFLGRRIPGRLAATLCDMAMPSRPLNRCSERDLRAFECFLRSWPILPGGTEGYESAEVTLGGVDTDGLSSKTMESKKVPGLYFIGEVVDVTGQLGGYNLHWAWASGFAAGQYA